MLFAEAFVTILVILDPIGNVPVFLALTREHDPDGRRRVAAEATAVAASVVFVFALFGQGILRLLGISLEALEVSGGLVLALVALQLLQGGGMTPPGAAVPKPSLVPLGTPLLAGPGAIAATMVYVRMADDVGEVLLVALALACALAVVYVALRYAAALARRLGDNTIDLLTRVVGVLLAAIAVQLIATGIDSWARNGV